MSYQAMEAVQDYSQYRHDDKENFAPFKIMLAIARNADRVGVAGVSGEHRKCLSHRGIAKIASVHRNTVSNWIPKLIQSGEITIETGGSGRATWTVYFLQLPIDDTTRTAEPATSPQEMAQASPQGMAQDIELLAQRMAHLSELLAQALAQGVATSPQNIATNGTSPLSKSDQIQDTLIQPETQIQPETAPDPADFFDFDWDSVLETLKNSMTKDTYAANFQGTTAAIRDGTLVIATKNQYQADWINGRLKKSVSRTVNDLTGHKLGVFARPESLAEAKGVLP